MRHLFFSSFAESPAGEVLDRLAVPRGHLAQWKKGKNQRFPKDSARVLNFGLEGRSSCRAQGLVIVATVAFAGGTSFGFLTFLDEKQFPAG